MGPDFELTGKVAIVTGGNGGIGYGIARGLATAGATVVIAARQPVKNAQAVAALQELGVNALGVPTDVQDEVSVQAMVQATVEAFGGVDILVNNAGINIRKAPQDYSLEEWQHVLNTNLTGVFLCSRAVYPHLVKRGGGKIINIGSMTSIFGSNVSPAYGASKGGVVQFTKSLAVFWAKDNIQVNVILPGWIHTDLTASASSERYHFIRARIPHGRWGEAEELAGAAVFLASRASDYVTGIACPWMVVTRRCNTVSRERRRVVNYVGQPLKRYEDPRLVTGHGSFVDDIRLPDMLYACVLRSPHAHARIKSIEVAAARRLPGVVAVLTGADLTGVLRDLPTRAMEGEWQVDEVNAPEQPVLAMDKVCYVGQPVAVVVARDRYVARDGMDLIHVDYAPLRPIIDPLEAAREDSIPIHEHLGTNIALRIHHDRQGHDLDAAFAQADRIVRQRYDVQRLAPVPLETRGLVAHYQPQEDFLTIWASTQGPHRVRRQLARLLNRPEDRVRVIAPDVGGGFGEKGGVFPEDVAIAYLAVSLGQPIKWVADRQENMLGFHGRGHLVDVDAAVQNDGLMLGIRLRIVADAGAYFGNSTPGPPYRASHRIIGPYKTPAARVEVLGVITNKPPTGAYRGAGGPESAFCMERTVDLIAKELDLDPAEVRRKNFIPPDAFPYQTPTGLTYDSGNYAKSLERALELAEYTGWRDKARRRKAPHEPLIGVGLATVIKMSGGSGDARVEEAWLTIEPSGHIVARTGVSPHGQGSETAFAQIVSDVLGVTPTDVRVLHGDTAVVPSGGGTGSTRGTVVGGSALHVVAQQARNHLSHTAADLLECAAEDIVFQDGRVFDRQHPVRAIPFATAVAAACHESQEPAQIEAGLQFSDSFTLGVPYQNPHAFGAHVAVVEVDPDTGEVTIVRYVAVHDCGRIINPLLVRGQVHGGIVQGIGQALWEGMVYSPEGQPLTGSLLDYAIPTAEGLPELITDTIETPSPMNPLGIKGVGELPTVAAPAAVANAVLDALWGFGVRHIDTPLSPEKIWRAVHAPRVDQVRGDD